MKKFETVTNLEDDTMLRNILKSRYTYLHTVDKNKDGDLIYIYNHFSRTSDNFYTIYHNIHLDVLELHLIKNRGKDNDLELQ